MSEGTNLKKLILQSQYIVEEFEETKEKMELYLQDLYKEFPEEYNNIISFLNHKENTPNPEGFKNITEEDEYEPEEEKKPESMRKLYRRISKMTHPDKIDSEFLNEYFKKASTAYAENNISELITIASFLNIDTSDVDKEEIISQLRSDIVTKQFFIANTKSSIAWRWANAKNDKEKEQIRKAIKKYAEDNY